MELSTRQHGTKEKVGNVNSHSQHTTARDMVITTIGGMITGGRPHWPWDWELDEDESAWIEFLFPRRIKIDRVVVHTYFSKKRRVQHGLGEALLQSWTGDRWTNLAEVRNGYIYSPTPSKPNRGRYEFNFVPVETDKLRLLVLRGDKKSTRKLQIVY